jgi:hypothetical protein
LNRAGYIFLITLFLISCEKKKVEPGQKGAFIKYFGGSQTQEGTVVEQTSDGGYIFIGSTTSLGAGGKDLYLVKTDEYGNTQWAKTFGGPGTDEGRCVRNTSDGGFILVGTFEDTSLVRGQNIYLLKVDGNGIEQWSRKIGKTTHNETGYSVQQTVDGGYAVIGTTTEVVIPKSDGSSSSPNDLNDVIFLKTDNLGNVEWSHIYGFDYPDRGTSIQQLNDSVYFTGGFRLSPTQDITIVRGREQGVQYTPNAYINKTLPIAEASIATASEIILANGFLFVVGSTVPGVSGTDIYILKLDLIGNKIWYKTFSKGFNDNASSIQTTNDGGLIVLGNTIVDTDNGRDIFLMKVNANGDMEWNKTFGEGGDDFGHTVRQTSDGGYILSGTISFGGNGIGANNVMVLIKTDSQGDIKVSE